MTQKFTEDEKIRSSEEEGKTISLEQEELEGVAGGQKWGKYADAGDGTILIHDKGQKYARGKGPKSKNERTDRLVKIAGVGADAADADVKLAYMDETDRIL